MFIGSKKFLDILFETGKIKPAQVNEWKNLPNLEIEKRLKMEHMISQEDISRAYATLYSLPFENLPHQKISESTLQFISEDLARKYKIIPYEISADQQTLKIGIADPANLTFDLEKSLQDLKSRKGIEIKLVIISPDDFSRAVLNYNPVPQEPVKKIYVNVAPVPSAPALGDKKTVDLNKIAIPLEIISKFPEDIARKYQMVVFEAPHPSLIKVAVANPNDKKVREILEFVEEKNDIAIDEYLVPVGDIIEAMKFYHPKPPVVPKPKIVPPPPPSQPISSQPPVFSPVSPPLTPNIPQTPRKFIAKPALASTLTPPTKPISTVPSAVPAPVVYQGYASQQGLRKEVIPEVKKPASLTPVMITPEETDLDQFVGEEVKEVNQLQAIAETGHIPKMVAAIVALAVFKKASDIHIEPEKTNIRIRFRVDGILRDIIKLPLEQHPSIISRIKILSKLKIDESRVPQDGRFDVKSHSHEIDLRVSTLPTVRGEKVAMRILDKSLRMYNLEELGVVGRNLKILTENIDKPFGIILSVGPTGCGKSTTLYSVLNRISTASVNIVTLEDPVEYEIAGINQCQIKPKIGFTFANGLRSVLRQDPNIIMVGEIRDAETAALATHAALTGHLVLSSLHTNDAAGALPRLINMGIEPFLITSSINVIIAQRLVRRLCPKCKKPAHIPDLVLKDIEEELAYFNFKRPYQFFEGNGCPDCDQGYHGRVGIFEVLPMTDKIEVIAIARRPASEIKTEAIKEGMVTMKQDGLLKALKGVTTVNEVLRVITS